MLASSETELKESYCTVLYCSVLLLYIYIYVYIFRDVPAVDHVIVYRVVYYTTLICLGELLMIGYGSNGVIVRMTHEECQRHTRY